MKQTELSYAVRGHVIVRYTARIGAVLAVLTLPPLVVALVAGELRTAPLYGAVVVVLLGLGVTLGRWPAPRIIQTNEGLVIASLVFVLAPAFMTLPLVGTGLPLIDAWFEAVSGITTTGLSTAGGVSGRPASFLFTRAWMQWYGGLGIVALSLALRMQPGAVARRLSGRGEELDLVSSTTAYTRTIVASYGALTVLGILLLVAVGLDPWRAVLHTFASVSTGGFSTSDSSLAGIGGTPVYYAVTLLCFCSALPLVLWANGVRQGTSHVLGDVQTRWLVASGAVVVAVIILLMALVEGLPWAQAIREGPVLALSAQTTTGFSSLSTAARSDVVKAVLLIAMSIGGCAGSTAGGVKILRLGILLSLVRFALRRSSMPRHAVLTFGLQGRALEESEVQKAVVIFLIGGITVGVSWLAFLLYGMAPLDSLFEVVSATATVGLSTGLSAPDLPAPLKLVLCADMLLGRVEFVGLLVLFYPRTWIGKRLEGA